MSMEVMMLVVVMMGDNVGGDNDHDVGVDGDGGNDDDDAGQCCRG